MLWHLMRKNKYMIKPFLLCFILFCTTVFGQTATPENYSKIKFVYEQKSNFLIQEGKLYADTLLFTRAFPEIKFIKTKSPIDSLVTIGFVTMESLNDKQLKLLEGMLYHATHTIEGTYDLKKNKTTLFFTRGSIDLINNYKKYFKWSYFRKYVFEKIIRYDRKKIYLNYPRMNYVASFNPQVINFTSANNDIGTYSYMHENLIHTNLVTLNKKYPNKITTDVIFSNNDYAVESIISLFDTIQLKLVSYQ